MSNAWWRHDDALHRFVRDVVAAELSSLRPTSGIPQSVAHRQGLHLVRDLGVDSLESVALASALNAALHLHVTGIEDHLLVRQGLSDWVEIARDGLEIFSDSMTFRTSGSEDVPKRCTHRLTDLSQEIGELVPQFRGRRRVLSAVRSHHIYGFLWGVLLPSTLELSSEVVVDVRERMPSSLIHSLHDGDLVVGYPEFWRMVADTQMPIPAGVVGLTSTAPCPPEVARALVTLGLDSLVELYGSSETAGVGVRTDPDASYELLSFWQRADAGSSELIRTSTDGSCISHWPQDTLEWAGDRHFRPVGRIDQAIQVAGVNVFPGKVRRVLLEHPGVADAAVRRISPDASGRLKAFIVPSAGAGEGEALHEELENWVAGRLSAPERPRAFSFGESIPLDSAGKPADWSVAEAGGLSPG